MEKIPVKGAATYPEKLKEEELKFYEYNKDKFQPYYLETRLLELRASNEIKLHTYYESLNKIVEIYLKEKRITLIHPDGISYMKEALSDFKYHMKQKGYGIQETSYSTQEKDHLEGGYTNVTTTYIQFG